jgi:hypothetical protein
VRFTGCLSARHEDGDNGAVRTCYHGYQSHQLLNSLFHSFRVKLERKGEGTGEAATKYLMRCVCVCMYVCVYVCMCKSTVVKILQSSAIVWPLFLPLHKRT